MLYFFRDFRGINRLFRNLFDAGGLRSWKYREADTLAVARPLRVYNKHDLAPEVGSERDDVILFSAKTGEGVPALLAAVQKRLHALHRETEFLIPYDRGDVTAYLHKYGAVLSEDYGADGCRVRVRLDAVTEERARRLLQR